MTEIVVDGFAVPSLLEAARAMWPAPNAASWFLYPNGKLSLANRNELPVPISLILQRISDYAPLYKLLDFEETNAFPDLHYLHGAGLHQMNPGVELGQHLDSERHPIHPWKREASAVLYLDDCAHGGELDFVDPSGNLLHRVQPKKNRLVLFKTQGNWHRVNKSETMRRSICLFFWSVDHDASGATKATFI